MGYRKALLKISVLFLVLVSIVACGKSVSTEEEVLVKEFLGKYYAQLSYSQEEQEAISQELEGLMLTIGLDGDTDNKLALEVEPNGFFNFFQETLSPQLYESMLANRKFPNWKMIEADFDKGRVKDLKIEEKDNTIYASYKIECYLEDSIVETKVVEVDFSLETDGENIYIDSIDGDLGWD